MITFQLLPWLALLGHAQPGPGVQTKPGVQTPPPPLSASAPNTGSSSGGVTTATPQIFAPTKPILVVPRSLRPSVPPTELRRAGLTDIPETFPYSVLQRRVNRLAPVEVERLIRSDVVKTVWVEEQIEDREPEGVGRVSEIFGGLRTATTGQYVFIEADRELKIEEELYAFRYESSDTGSASGAYVVRFIANLRVVAVMNIDDRPVYRARVLGAQNTVEKGDQVQMGRMPTTEFSSHGDRVALRGEVIVPHSRGHSLGPLGGFIFVSEGLDAGFRPNQILSIMANPKSRNHDSTYSTPLIAIALARVVHTTPTYSTLMVLQSHDAVYPGDFTADPDRFTPVVGSPYSSRPIIDLSDDAFLSDPWAIFRPYMNMPIPEVDMQESRRIDLGDQKSGTPSVDPKSDSFDPENGWVDDGEEGN